MTRPRRAGLLLVPALLAAAVVVAQSPHVVVAAPLPLTPIIATGDRHSLVLDADGILYSFGENFSGQLGYVDNIGTELPNPLPTQVMTGVDQVAAGAYFSMALKDDGTLWTFGDNSTGQLGTTTNSGTALPNPVPKQVLTNVIAIAAGAFHAMALKADGSLWTWGYNWDGELGRSDNNLSDAPNPTPTEVLLVDAVSQIAAGAFHSLALMSDGTLLTFGSNEDGQLGYALNAGTLNPNPDPTPVATLTDVASIAAGGFHSLAVTGLGHLMTFGFNLYGQLGHAINSGVDNPPPNATPVDVLQDVVRVAAGSDHSMALKVDGTLWTFGLNFDGQLGRNTVIDDDGVNALPTLTLDNVTELAGGGRHSLVLTGDDGLLSFGFNLQGQLGTNLNSGADAGNPTPMTVVPPEYRPLVPRRLLDSRTGGATDDGASQGIGLRAAGTTTELQVTGRGGVAPVAAAVVLNVTVTGATADGYVTVYPCGSPLPNASNLNFRTGDTIPNLVAAEVGVGGKVCLYTSATTHLIVDVTGYYPILPTFESVGPNRILDSRAMGATVDGQSQAIGLRAAGSTTELLVAGRGGVDVDASTAVLNVTVTGAQGSGFVTVYPCGSPQPNASNINFPAGATIPNLVITKVGVGGRVCIFTSAATQLIADVSGFYPAISSFESLVPGRLLDSRPGGATIDGQSQAIGLRAAGTTTELQVTNRGGVPADAGSAVLNITATGAQAGGFIAVYPCGSPLPNSSNLNYAAGATIANLVVSKIGTGGKVCIFTSAGTHLIADVGGYYAP